MPCCVTDSTGIKFLGDGALSWFASKLLPRSGQLCAADHHKRIEPQAGQPFAGGSSQAMSDDFRRKAPLGHFCMKGRGGLLGPGRPERRGAKGLGTLVPLSERKLINLSNQREVAHRQAPRSSV